MRSAGCRRMSQACAQTPLRRRAWWTRHGRATVLEPALAAVVVLYKVSLKVQGPDMPA